jgi:ACT domain-containing protein
MDLEEFKKLSPLQQEEVYLQFKKEKDDHYTLMEYRCSTDTRINIQLWEKLYKKLKTIYVDDTPNMLRLIHILNWIMDCSFMQEKQKIKVDVEKLTQTIDHFEKLKEAKVEQLKKAMPKIEVIKEIRKPDKMFTIKGDITKAYEKWVNKLYELGLPKDYDKSLVRYIDSYDEPNPNSVIQKKDWLYSLGWKPVTFKHNRNKETGEVKVVEQIMTEDKMLCPSVLKLLEKEPAIEAFDGLTVLTHRIGLLKGFRDSMDENQMIPQGLASLAVTMRWMHRTIVNLPRYTGSGDLRDGKWIRECLIAGEGNIIVQSDLSGIESRTSDHYTFHINPDRIIKTQMPYFDPHTEISVTSKLMSVAEEVFYVFKGAKKENPDLDIHTFSELYKWSEEVQRLLDLPEDEQKSLLNKIKNARSKGKTTNYASLYLVGAKTLARNLEIPENEAQGLIDAYWKVNFAVKEVSETFVIKKVGDENWVFNPISKFWYFCRDVRNVFSVINQSSAVYCFNMWVYNCTKQGIWPVTQSHDDQLYIVKEEDAERVQGIILKAMDKVNKQLKLNVKLDCETQTGKNVAETH